MPRKKAEPVQAPVQVPVVDPNALFFSDTLLEVLRLRPNTLRREVRLGRLRVSKRAGRYYCTGAWVLDWIRGGVVPRREQEATAKDATHVASLAVGGGPKPKDPPAADPPAEPETGH